MDHVFQNITLSRRMKLPEPDKMADFMIAETITPDIDNYPIVWDRAAGQGQRADFNTALLMEYKYPIRDSKEFSMSTTGLHGCTVLAIISRKAVYMTHYWESITFAPDAESVARYQSRDRIFQLFIEKGLRSGIGQQQHALGRGVKDIDDEHIQAYLLRPSDTWERDPQGYPDQWDAIKRIVGELIPRLKIESGQQNDRWHDIVYERVEDEDQLEGHRGKCLFKFDPQHYNSQLDKKRKKAMFWNEDNPVAHHSDEWD